MVVCVNVTSTRQERIDPRDGRDESVRTPLKSELDIDFAERA